MGIQDGSYDLVPLDGMRKAIARRLTDSFRDVPHFPLTIDCEHRRPAGRAGQGQCDAGEAQGVKVSVNDFVMKASAMALKAVPEANASYTPEGIAMHHHADVAMAVAIDGGLITPIIFASRDQIAQPDRDGVEGPRQTRARSQAEARRVPGRHLLGLEPRHVRHQGLRLDHQ
jgi:pyruvate dehydrogenase E2 component (dihydrolipoamide acetyltransferase)